MIQRVCFRTVGNVCVVGYQQSAKPEKKNRRHRTGDRRLGRWPTQRSQASLHDSITCNPLAHLLGASTRCISSAMPHSHTFCFTIDGSNATSAPPSPQNTIYIPPLITELPPWCNNNLACSLSRFQSWAILNLIELGRQKIVSISCYFDFKLKLQWLLFT